MKKAKKPTKFAVSILTFAAVMVTNGCASSSSAKNSFDIFSAMKVIETQAPTDGSLFIKFHIPVGAKVSESADELEPILETAARRKRQVGILGADTQINAEVTENALARFEDGALTDLTLIYMAPSPPPEVIPALAKSAGATFRFLKFPSEN